MRAPEAEVEPARVLLGALHGERAPHFSEAAIEEAIDAHTQYLAAGGTQVLKHDDRSRVTAANAGGLPVVVKEVAKGGMRRRLADALRGSAARRGWRAARAISALGIGVAEPLAFVEERRWGLPVRSWLIARDLRPAVPAPDLAARSPADASAVLHALCDLAIALHRGSVAHGDLRAQHVYVSTGTGTASAATGTAPRVATWLIDLESARVRRHLSDAARIEALAQLNASLADDLAANDDRRRAFDRYTTALPFQSAGGNEAALTQVVQKSRARSHLWQGKDCTTGTPETR